MVNFSGANFEGANLVGAYLLRANLEGANFEAADLENANLAGTGLWYCGELRYRLYVSWGWTRIRCQVHPNGDWRRFDDAKIADMAPDALAFWQRHKAMIFDKMAELEAEMAAREAEK
jgi:uncharacterized protein YjbI with pentapeptide repeats